METTKLKRFATEARAKLRAGVATKIKSLGFDADGNAVPGSEPTRMVGGCTWNGQILPSAFAEQWEALRHRLQTKGLKEVVEEAAYTWFNRLMAIRILAMNGISEPVLRFVDDARTPKIVDDARQGRVIPMSDQQLQRLNKLFADPTRISEQFALLVTEFCHQIPILQACFGSLADYTEILLPNNILDKDGFIDMLNSADFISEDDYKSAELIGWLYQFYISDRKDEVFAKKGKVEADEIPAATQIFTPNWIVKYMVQNAILPQVRSNRLPEKDKKYLINDELPEEPKKPKDLKVADLACGSGHILNECFDLLFDLYIASGYGRADAIESIFRNNLVGIDIDERARQLATFALMLKACQRDESFADAHILPKILTAPEMPELVQNPKGYLPHFFLGNYDHEIDEAWEAVKNAHTLGSIIKFNISPATRFKMEQKVNEWRREREISHGIQVGLPVMDFILALTDSYDAVIANPPYMTGGKMNPVLSQYVKENYGDATNDLFAVFIEMMLDRTIPNGKVGCITMDAWMFLPSFEDLRKKILSNYFIESLGHFGWNMIGIAFGTVMSIISKSKPDDRYGIYSYLTIEDIDKETNAPKIYPKKDNGRYAILKQKVFYDLPTASMAYWISPAMMKLYSYHELPSICETRCGLATGRNDIYLRLWHEVSFNNIGFNCSRNDTIANGLRWYPYDKGGEVRKWYGNRDYVLDWYKDGYDLQTTMHPDGNRIWAHNFNLDKIFQQHIGWSDVIGINKPLSFRYFEKGFNFDGSANAVFTDEENVYLILAYANSIIATSNRKILNSGNHFKPGNFLNLPFKSIPINKSIIKECISISKQDWDAHETSWDFKTNPLISEICSLPKEASVFKDSREDNFEILFPELVRCDANLEDRLETKVLSPSLIEDCLISFRQNWTELFKQLHQNEERINEEFIKIYGLQDELDSHVDLRDITILQQGEITIDADDVDGSVLFWNKDVIIKQLISYMVGVWMGRYRLDRPGLNIAHPDPTDDELASYQYGPDNATLRIDDDAIIPILPTGAPFEDNLSKYIADFVRIAWGETSQTDNLNFIEKCLGKKIEDYVQKDFWKDHKKMYQNRPIYWLFSSKKGAFKALVYVHRMHPYTVEQVRTRYLLKYMDWLRSEAQRLEIRDADLTTAERRRLDRLRTDIEECEEYHERLQVVAENAIPIDLDNGIPANHALFGDIVTKLK